MRTQSVFILTIIFLKSSSCVSSPSENNTDEFIPTKDWQEIKEGQKVPKGLHYRINLETGKKEARLLDEGNKNKALLQVQKEEPDITPNDIKVALKNIKADFEEKSYPNDNKKKLRSFEEIKRDLEDLNLFPKTDFELLHGLFKNLKMVMMEKKHKTIEILRILDDLEFLIHQFDNANEFVKLGGMKDIIYTNLNQTNKEIKTKVLKLLGTALQNNIKVKIYALETDCVVILLKILVLDEDLDVRLKTIYALGSLLRHFPLAQKYFLENGGLQTFSKTFYHVENSSIRLKIITLINDLLVERHEARNHIDATNPQWNEKVKQYESTNFQEHLKQNDWCNLLRDHMGTINIDDLDGVEKSLEAVDTFSDFCKDKFQEDPRMSTILGRLHEHFTKLQTENDDPESDIYENFMLLTLRLASKLVPINSNVKTEL